MTEETLALSDAPEPVETEVTEVTPEVDEELKSEELSDSSPEPEEKPKADPVQKRIDELTRKRREAERDSEYWREQALKNKPEPEPAPVEEPLKTLADFDYDELKYQQHLFDLSRQGAVKEAQRILAEEKTQQEVSKKVSGFKAKEAEFSKDIEDYRDVVKNPSLPITQVMAETAMEMDNGPEVLYYLGKNPDIAEEIAQLSPLRAALELGRIEAKFQQKGGKKVSDTPAPPPKIAALDPVVSKNPDEMTQKEWNEHRRKIIANRGN